VTESLYVVENSKLAKRPLLALSQQKEVLGQFNVLCIIKWLKIYYWNNIRSKIINKF